MALAALRAARESLALEYGVPAALICHDRALEAMARARPGSLDALDVAAGLGRSRTARYGAAFLDALRS